MRKIGLEEDLKKRIATIIGIGIVAAAALVLFAEEQKAPALSSATMIAIQSCEEHKSQAQNAWKQAQDAENGVVQEWEKANPGWIIDAADGFKVKVKKPEEKK